MLLKYTWLPADTPDSAYPNLHIYKANGSYLIDNNNEQIFDGISSWWCKPLGHAHPIVINSIKEQLNYFEHHIPASAWNNTIEKLSSKLVNIFTEMDKVMYASDGSSAIEIAMKLSYESRVLTGNSQKCKYIALSGGYHGETIFTLGVCGLNGYKKNYESLLSKNYFIEQIPYVASNKEQLWEDCQFDYSYWDDYFSNISQFTTALIIEPIVQGAAGMKIISKDFLQKIILLAKKYGLHIIADEIMVGLGRLGCLSVSKDYLNIEPDLVCFAKNLTAGSIPMSAVVINKSISDTFRKFNQKFHHSHTHSCNAIAANVAYNYLEYLELSQILKNVKLTENKLCLIMENYKHKFSFIETTRVIGSIAAMEIDLNIIRNNSIFELAIQELIYIRMIGNVLYIMPPLYNLEVDIQTIDQKLLKLFEKLTPDK